MSSSLKEYLLANPRADCDYCGSHTELRKAWLDIQDAESRLAGFIDFVEAYIAARSLDPEREFKALIELDAEIQDLGSLEI